MSNQEIQDLTKQYMGVRLAAEAAENEARLAKATLDQAEKLKMQSKDRLDKAVDADATEPLGPSVVQAAATHAANLTRAVADHEAKRKIADVKTADVEKVWISLVAVS